MQPGLLPLFPLQVVLLPGSELPLHIFEDRYRAMTRDVLHDELERIWQATGLTVVFVTHNVREAVRLGDRVVLLATRPGRVKLDMKIDLARPRDSEAEVAYYVGRIMKDLRVEVDKVMREEVDDAYFSALASGAVAGMLTCAILNAAHIAVPIGVQLFLMNDTLTLLVDPVKIFLSVAFITFCTSAISLIPSLLAARMKPITAMHYIG